MTSNNNKFLRLLLCACILLGTTVLAGCGSSAYNERYEQRGDKLRYGENE